MAEEVVEVEVVVVEEVVGVEVEGVVEGAEEAATTGDT